MRAQYLSIYRKAVWTKDGRLPPEPVLGDSVMSGRHLRSVISGPETASGDDGPEATCPEMTAALASEHRLGRQSSVLSPWRVPQARCIWRRLLVTKVQMEILVVGRYPTNFVTPISIHSQRHNTN